ncbi:TIGR03086 family protein [Arthrobacter sp. MYb224]|uniref:TIGR03086 family metal-binding protein n=1 Tax=Arthrobacter sp. MYb224 TaxID=1848600 RepID=UPI000CFC47DF|nr:TIGR03086 family metal-binding protein [Arthrobacter sp. MYb224]PQZ97190.1 TIGR03086 family protein [Arthrobacter sp. MYb224]
MSTPQQLTVKQLERALSSVAELIKGTDAGELSAPTPCTDWTVRELIAHLVGMNLVFTALMTEQSPPQRTTDVLGDDPLAAYLDSSTRLLAAFDRPGALERSYQSPMGSATGQERLQIRMYDLLAHGWDLAQATGQRLEPLEDLAEQALQFVRRQLADQPRTGRFDPVQAIADDAPAIERLVAFLGRRVEENPTP